MPSGTKEQAREQQKRYRNRIRKYILDYKKDKKCGWCGWNEHTEILNFHHGGDKELKLAEAAKYHMSREKIDKEIKKCILLCPNCHMWHHFKEREGKKVIKEWK